MNRVGGKVALVTGGGGGIGGTCCELLAKAGAKVIVSDMNTSFASEVARKIVNAGGEAIALGHDVTSETDWEKVVDATIKHFGKLDVLVNNAGMAIAGECKDTSLENWQKVIDVNLSGVFLGIRSAINLMLKNRNTGSIINISSGYGLVGGGLGFYSAAKGGVAILTKSIAVECARLGYNIRVNTIHPGAVDTQMGRIHADDAENERAQAEYSKQIPMGRFGKPIEIANGVLFLAPDDSSYMTGSAIVIDGGYTAA